MSKLSLSTICFLFRTFVFLNSITSINKISLQGYVFLEVFMEYACFHYTTYSVNDP